MNYKTAIMATCLLLMALASGCRKNDFKTLTIQVPDMKNEACEQVVRRALGAMPGLKPETVRFDLEAGTVTFTYDTLLASDKNAEHMIARAGFRVLSKSLGKSFEIPADPKARAELPPECNP